MKIGICGALTLFCLALLIIMVVATIREVSLLVNGVETKGIIVGWEVDPLGSESGYFYFAVFEFTDPRTGGKITRTNPTSDAFRKYEVGDQVDIIYDPNTGYAEIKGSVIPGLQTLLLGASLFALPTGLFAVLWRLDTHAPRTTAKHRGRYFLIISVICVFIVPMLLMLLFYVGLNIWMISFVAVLYYFVILFLYKLTRPL